MEEEIDSDLRKDGRTDGGKEYSGGDSSDWPDDDDECSNDTILAEEEESICKDAALSLVGKTCFALTRPA